MTVKFFRHPTSGATVVCSVGGAFQVYQNPDPGPPAEIPPDWLTAPSFVSGLSYKIGTVLFMNSGTPVPSTAATEIEIGTGTGAADFAGPTITPNGTIPSAWAVGASIVAKCTAINDGLSKTVYVVAGTTVQAADVSTFPAALTIADWDASEVRTSAPAGRRQINVYPTVTIPAGYELVLYSNTGDPDTQPSQFATTLVPGQSYVTGSSLGTGTTCNNRLWWRRVSDGVLDNPSNTVTFTMLGLSITPPDPPSGIPDLSEDTTAASSSAVRTAILARIASGTSGDYVIGYSGTSAPDLSGLNNTLVTSNYANVIYVRPVVSGTTYTDNGASINTACSRVWSGDVNMNGSRGIHIALAHVRGGLTSTDSNYCGTYGVLLEGASPSESVVAGNLYGYKLQRATGFRRMHCLTQYYRTSGVYFDTCSGIREYGCYDDLHGTDARKIFTYADGHVQERCWVGPKWTPLAGAHFDFRQHQGRTNTNCRAWGNISVRDGDLQGFFHKWEGAPVSLVDSAGKRQYPLEFTGSRWEQNLHLSSLGSFLGSTFPYPGSNSYPGAGISYNTNITYGYLGQNTYGAVLAGIAPLDHNYVAAGNPDISWMAQNGGLHRAVGKGVSSGTSARDYSLLVNDFEFGVPWQDVNGYSVSSALRTLKYLRPKSTGGTSQLHWSHGAPTGAYLRMREIYDTSYRATATTSAGYPVYPFMWPVLGRHHYRLNSDSYVTDGFTGSWNPTTGLPA